MHKALVVNLQRFSLHDGPGVRTTIFFKGCPLACRWCHNPESRSFRPEIMFFPDRCTGCGGCEGVCPSKDECLGCGACAQGCPFDARALVGTRYDARQLYALASRDRGLYDLSGGGVTLSGGEPMAQDAGFLADLLTRFKRRGIHVAIDTCGHAAWAAFEQVLPLADLFLYDFKALDAALHERLTGRDNAVILQNLARLARVGARINLRVPVVPGANADEDEMRRMAAFAFETAGNVPVSLLPYHRVGSDKAERLSGGEAALFDPPSPRQMEAIEAIWRGAGFDRVRVGG